VLQFSARTQSPKTLWASFIRENIQLLINIIIFNLKSGDHNPLRRGGKNGAHIKAK